MTRIRAALCTGGALMMAYAVVGLMTDPDIEPGGMLVFLAAALIAHDVVWLPAVIAFGAVLTRFVSRRHRPAAQIAAVVVAAPAVVALPLVLGVGRAADNPSIQPLDYGKNVTLLLLALAGGALVAMLYRRVAARDRDRDRPA
jgi:predicted cobalt transporter CbtA